MPVSRLFSAAFLGLEGILVEVEVDLVPQNFGSIRIVGLPDAAVKESKDRVFHAIKNSGYSVEAHSCMVHLAPAEIKKMGSFYDLPIALGILQGLGVFNTPPFEEYLIGGELGLAGEVRPICGALALSLLAKQLGKRGILIPKDNATEAALVSEIEVIGLHHLQEAILFFKQGKRPQHSSASFVFKPRSGGIDMQDIAGQTHAKRALEIAATGNHNIIMSGPPGTGKSMLAKAFISILPPLSLEESLEVSSIYSLAGFGSGIVEERPFRAPHHTISFAGMIGGSTHPKPGEISLAHKGILFLDELPEFSRSTLEVLRQPLEDKKVTISRAGGKVSFPTDVILVAAMNPCPCGFLGHPEKSCRDTALQIQRYRNKISGPLLDRIDLHLTIPPLPFHEMSKARKEVDSSTVIRERVSAARRRFNKAEIPSIHQLNKECQGLLKEAVDITGISARACNRLLKVAYTIALLAEENKVREDHILEALSYREMTSS